MSEKPRYRDHARQAHYWIAFILLLAGLWGAYSVYGVLSAAEAAQARLELNVYEFGMSLALFAAPIPLLLELYRVRSGKLLSTPTLWGIMIAGALAVLVVYEGVLPALYEKHLNERGYVHCEDEDFAKSSRAGSATQARNVNQRVEIWRLSSCKG